MPKKLVKYFVLGVETIVRKTYSTVKHNHTQKFESKQPIARRLREVWKRFDRERKYGENDKYLNCQSNASPALVSVSSTMRFK